MKLFEVEYLNKSSLVTENVVSETMKDVITMYEQHGIALTAVRDTNIIVHRFPEFGR